MRLQLRVVALLLLSISSPWVSAQSDEYPLEGTLKAICLGGWFNAACTSDTEVILRCSKEYNGEQAQRVCQYQIEKERRRWERLVEAQRKVSSPKVQAPAATVSQPKPVPPPAKVRVPARRDPTLAEIEAARDSVVSSLSAAASDAAPPVPDFADTESRLSYLRWLGHASGRLEKQKPDWSVRKEFLQTLWYESRRGGFDPSLILGLIETVSNFHKFYVSENGARGYMGISPSWVDLLADGDRPKLFHAQTNLRFGCVILRHYLDQRKGDLRLALQDYYESNHFLIDGKHQPVANFATLVLKNELHWR